jgi:hypothetical protein
MPASTGLGATGTDAAGAAGVPALLGTGGGCIVTGALDAGVLAGPANADAPLLLSAVVIVVAAGGDAVIDPRSSLALGDEHAHSAIALLNHTSPTFHARMPHPDSRMASTRRVPCHAAPHATTRSKYGRTRLRSACAPPDVA